MNPSTNEKWFIISSNERFRISEYDSNTSNYLSKNNLEKKFLFLEDFDIVDTWSSNEDSGETT